MMVEDIRKNNLDSDQIKKEKDIPLILSPENINSSDTAPDIRIFQKIRDVESHADERGKEVIKKINSVFENIKSYPGIETRGMDVESIKRDTVMELSIAIQKLKDEIKKLEEDFKDPNILNKNSVEAEILRKEDEIREIEEKMPQVRDLRRSNHENEKVEKNIQSDVVRDISKALDEEVSKEINEDKKVEEEVVSQNPTITSLETENKTVVDKESEEKILSPEEKFSAACFFGFGRMSDFASLKTNEEKEKYVEEINKYLEKNYSPEAIAKGVEIAEAQEAYKKVYKDIESKRREEKSKDFFELYDIKNGRKAREQKEFCNEKMRELSKILEKDGKNPIENINICTNYFKKQNNIKNEVEFELNNNKPGFFSKITREWSRKWNSYSKTKKTLIAATLVSGAVGFGVAASGAPLLIVGSTMAVRLGRGLFGGGLSATVQKWITNPLVDKFRNKEEEKLKDEEIGTVKEYASTREYENLRENEELDKLADRNVEIGEVIAKDYGEKIALINKKDRKRKLISAVATGAVVGGLTSIAFDGLLSGGAQAASEGAASTQPHIDFATANRGDSVWTLLEKDLSHLPGYDNLPRFQQNYITDYYKDIVVKYPHFFGLRDANLIQPGYGEQLKSLFIGPNAVSYEEVFNKATSLLGK